MVLCFPEECCAPQKKPGILGAFCGLTAGISHLAWPLFSSYNVAIRKSVSQKIDTSLKVAGVFFYFTKLLHQ